MRKYVISITFLLLLAASVFVIFSPADRESVLAENREPQQMPEFTIGGFYSGEFASLTDSCIDDNIGYRSGLIDISDKIQTCFGYVPKNLGRIITTTKDIGTDESQESRLLIYDNKIMEMFESRQETETKYADSLNRLRDLIPWDVEMYSMLVPTQLEFCAEIYRGAQDSQKEAIENVYSQLSGITPVDTYGKLKEAVDGGESYLYYMTDHHWTMDGAYCGYRAFADAADFEPYERDDFPKVDVGSFYGALYLKAKSQLEDQPEDEMEYYDVSDVTDFSIVMRSEDNVTEYSRNSPIFRPENGDYNTFFGGDHPLIEITNNDIDEDGETLIVIKDSYAGALLPWIIENYKKTIVIDPRSYGGDLLEEIEDSGADKILTVNYIFTTTFDDYCDMLTGLTNEEDGD